MVVCLQANGTVVSTVSAKDNPILQAWEEKVLLVHGYGPNRTFVTEDEEAWEAEWAAQREEEWREDVLDALDILKVRGAARRCVDDRVY